jgi:hypothetical protein
MIPWLIMRMSGDLSENMRRFTDWRLQWWLVSRNDPSLSCRPDFVANCVRPLHNPRMWRLVWCQTWLQWPRQDECLPRMTRWANIMESPEFGLTWTFSVVTLINGYVTPVIFEFEFRRWDYVTLSLSVLFWPEDSWIRYSRREDHCFSWTKIVQHEPNVPSSLNREFVPLWSPRLKLRTIE